MTSPPNPDQDSPDIPPSIISTVERLTRYERHAQTEEEARHYCSQREQLLAHYDYDTRVREEKSGDVLVLYPKDWMVDGTVQIDMIDDTSRAVEIPLEGTEHPTSWDAVNEYNRSLVRTISDDHGAIHGENARVFADFLGNHYAKRIEATTSREIEEFLTEYFIRNAWPSPSQRECIEESLELLLEVADTTVHPQWKDCTP